MLQIPNRSPWFYYGPQSTLITIPQIHLYRIKLEISFKLEIGSFHSLVYDVKEHKINVLPEPWRPFMIWPQPKSPVSCPTNLKPIFFLSFQHAKSFKFQGQKLSSPQLSYGCLFSAFKSQKKVSTPHVMCSQRFLPKNCPYAYRGLVLHLCHNIIKILIRNWPLQSFERSYPIRSPLQRCVLRVSLAVQWLRIHLPMHGTRVPSLLREGAMCHGATRPLHRNYRAHAWARAQGTTSCKYWSPHT